tara:strand:+ start:154 stop:543 length:390 start_codon:yes stop_codon:yes gene_type:complete
MKKKEKKISSNRSFAFTFFVVLLIFSLWPLIYGGEIRLVIGILSLIFLILGVLNSKILSPLNKYWIKFGELLGKIIAPIIMALIYFVIITPISLIIKIFGKDLLNIKFSKDKTYWIKRKKDLGQMKKQF